MEATAIIPEVLSRMKDLELAGPVERVRSNLMNGIRSMPVTFTAASVADAPLRQRKLLTYLPISRASARLAPDGWPVPKSGVNSWYGPTAAATSA